MEAIQQSGFAQIELIVLNTPEERQPPALKQRLRNYWKLALYHRYEQWDTARNRSANDAKARFDLAPLLRGTKKLKVRPLRKGFSDYLSEEDIAAVRSENLDVLFRFGFRIVRGEILQAARCGIWSFHHGDNLEYRGGPPLFWEVYEGNPVSGTVLQVLTRSLDGGKVLYRSHSATNLRSLYRNRNPIYWKTAEFALRRLSDLHTRGWEYLQSLPTYNEPSSSAPIYRTPNAAQMLIFLCRLFGRAVRASLFSRVHGGYSQWFLATRERSSSRFDDAAGYKVQPTPEDRFYADPFAVEREGTTYLFFEDYRYSEQRAVICCAAIRENGSLGTPVEVLRRPYHLSYPFLFESEGTMYMIPETRENRTVELYRAESFPFSWVLETVLLENISAVDATIHREGDRFWMFVGLSNGKYSNCDELALFSAPSLFGPWTPHPGNPVVSNVRCARPAGALFFEQGKLIRPAQDCARAYGYALVFSEVQVLSETEYREKPMARLDPGWLPRNLGTHTYTRSGRFEVIDGNLPKKLSASKQ